jgi:hypothetical protein
MFKSVTPAIVAVSVLAAPALAFAQDSSAVTRSDVKADLVQLEQAGYNPGSDKINYPQSVQAAEQHVAAKKDVAQTSYGSPSGSSSHSGVRVIAPQSPQSSYFPPSQ